MAGTATSLAAIDLELDPYDPERVHGHTLMRGRIEELLARLAQMPLAERRKVIGLHPDRAPTIVAGCVLLIEALRLFGLQSVEISEHDILRGAAIAAVGLKYPPLWTGPRRLFGCRTSAFARCSARRVRRGCAQSPSPHFPAS